jgi:RNA polymerase sigma-70 factor (ECF subfamily)
MPPSRRPGVARQSDEELLRAARAGEDQAFRRLVERYEGQVAATVVGMLGPGDEAEDVGQETFIRFYRAMGNYRGEAGLGTYITRIAINLSLKALRRRQTWIKRFVSRDDEDAVLAEPFRDGEGEVERRSQADMVRVALESLKPEHRVVVVLRMLEGYSTRETAEILNVPQGTVMSRLSRALEKLKGLLGPYLGPEA